MTASLRLLVCLFYCQSATAFLKTATTMDHDFGATSSSALRAAGFEQLPGESTTDFIKRVTANADAIMDKQKSSTERLTAPSSRKPRNASKNYHSRSTSDAKDDEDEKPKGRYQRIEDWDAERKATGELTWEEKVQFDGQRFGNQVKQDSILRRHLGTF